MAQPWLHSGMRVKIEQIHDLLMDAAAVVARCRSRGRTKLAKELFTHRGSGTLVRRGEKIRCVHRVEEARPEARCKR